MKIIFAVFLVVHGLIHLMGTLKAFGFAEIPQLTQQIDRPRRRPLAPGCGAAPRDCASPLLTWPHWWWVVGASAVVVSQAVIVTSWAMPDTER